MTCIVDITTKKALASRVAAEPKEVWIEDPSLFHSRGRFTAAELLPGEKVVVTNHPRRSWFASIERRTDGTLVVK